MTDGSDHPRMTGRERVLRHLCGELVDRLPLMPITMQFACDCLGANYLEYETDYRVLVEAQIEVARDFGFDYVNTMSDPAREAADCGATVVYPPNQPAALDESEALLRDKAALGRLEIPDPLKGKRMSNGLAALRSFRDRIGGEKLIEGWIEGPCAEAADLRGINTLMLDLIDDPVFVCCLFEFCVEMELRFARAQVDAGAELIGIGDAATSLVGPRHYRERVFPYEKRLVEGVRALGVPVRLHICGNTRPILREMGALGCDIVDLDFLAPVEDGRAAMGPNQVLLGNIDPVRVLLEGMPGNVESGLEKCHRAAGSRYIVGAGCEVPRDTPEENLHAMRRYAFEHAP